MLYIARKAPDATYFVHASYEDGMESAILALPDYQDDLIVKTPKAYAPMGPMDVRGCTRVRDPDAPKVVVVAKIEFYRRCSEQEALAIDAAFAAQPLRLRRIYDAAQTFRTDAEEWTLLLGAATQLFGADRAAQLLAPTQ